jgi:hypothetical protein
MTLLHEYLFSCVAFVLYEKSCLHEQQSGKIKIWECDVYLETRWEIGSSAYFCQEVTNSSKFSKRMLMITNIYIIAIYS